jgi:hypothetical protein
LCLGRWLKFTGFFINCCASLYLIYVALFVGEVRSTVWDYIHRRVYLDRAWRHLKVSRETNDADVLITSALVIVGSSLQMVGDIFDP